jgi:hypothetical protein
MRGRATATFERAALWECRRRVLDLRPPPALPTVCSASSIRAHGLLRASIRASVPSPPTRARARAQAVGKIDQGEL